MNKLLYFTFLLLTFQIQAQQWDQAFANGITSGYNDAFLSRQSPSGNTVAFQYKYNWNGNSHSDLICYNYYGDTLWKHHFMGLSVTDIAFDDKEDIYFSGDFSDTIAIEDELLVSAGLNDAVVGKLSSKGTIIKIKVFGSRANERTGSLVVSNDGVNVYGKFKNSFKVDAVNYEPDCSEKCFVSFTKDLVARNNSQSANKGLAIVTSANSGELDVYAPHADNNAMLEIYNATGQLVLKENLSKNQFHANIAGVNQGIYSLVVQNVDGTISQDKFTKE